MPKTFGKQVCPLPNPIINNEYSLLNCKGLGNVIKIVAIKDIIQKESSTILLLNEIFEGHKNWKTNLEAIREKLEQNKIQEVLQEVKLELSFQLQD